MLCVAGQAALALYYSPNAVTWHLATSVRYRLPFEVHPTHTDAILEGEDLVVVSHVAVATGSRALGFRMCTPTGRGTASKDACLNAAIAVQRIKHIRSFANRKWAVCKANLSRTPRRTALLDEHPRLPAAQLA